jgi:hypothetical protein
MSPIKEPNYFARDFDYSTFSSAYLHALLVNYRRYISGPMDKIVHIAHVHDATDYLRLFRNVTTETAIGEVSNSYLYSKIAASEIRAVVPHAKIIIILRNPTSRAYSQYLMDLRIGYVRGSFSDELLKDLRQSGKSWGGHSRCYVEMGLYYQQVKRYFDLFPPEQMRVFLYDDLEDDWNDLLNRLHTFLGVEPGVSGGLPRLNGAAIPRLKALNYVMHRSGLKRAFGATLPAPLKSAAKRLFYTPDGLPQLGASDRQKLTRLFADDIQKLEQLIGRDLSAWRS